MKTNLTILLLLVTYCLYGQYATIPFTDDFTAGGTSLNSTYWSTSFTNTAGRIEQRNEVGSWPKFTLNNGMTGPSGKGMTVYNSTTTTSENKLSAMLRVDALNKTNVSLDFNIVDWGTGTNWGAGATQCMDSLKVYVSNDGGSTYGSSFSLVNLNQSPYNDGIWNHVTVNISQLATDNSLVLTATTVIKMTFNLKGSGDTTSPKSGNQMIYLDNLTVTNVGGLPVELVQFSCKENQLTWITASEINNDYFILSSSRDTIIQGGGNVNHFTYYNYVVAREDYYQLKQVDFDGKITVYSTVYCGVSVNKNKKLIAIYNVLGQEVDSNYEGVQVLMYSDGTSVKIVK